MLSLLVLLTLSVSFAKDNIPYCPNGDAPKTDDSGAVIMCLPGQSSKIVCGKGYSCFFSGYNYQCCPQGEEEEEDPLECPMNALTVLDAMGDPVKCEKAKCPRDTMFCSKQGSTAICCESLLTATQESTPIKKDVPKVEAIEDECPSNSLTVLNDYGNPLVCSSAKSCPQSTMKCQSVGKVSLCCEPLHSASSKEESLYVKDVSDSAIRTPAQRKQAEKSFNPLKYVESDAKVLSKNHLKDQGKVKTGIIYGEGEMPVLHTSSAVSSGTIIKKSNATTADILSATVKASTQLGSKPLPLEEKSTTLKQEVSTEAPKTTPSSTRGTTTIVDVDIKEEDKASNQSAFVDIDIPEEHEKPRAQGIQTAQDNQIKEQQFEYKPHSSGGYAIAEKATTKRPPLHADAKKIARKFLIDQIKRGWPYDDSFYHPNEDVEFVRSGSRSVAAVHFPK
uniref:Secreted protein n=1 Tax=Steinernema glaseri TaxID=37863 RepID=A0A1I8AH45_9BILA